MKKILSLSLVVVTLLLTAISCKKDKENTEPTNNEPVTTCTGGNLCFTLNGQDMVFNTKLEQMSDTKYRIATTDAASGDNWKRVEIYIFGDGTVGDYPFNFSGAPMSANMLYFGNENGASFQYMSEDTGTLKLASTTNGKWSGTFSCKMSKQGVSGTTYSLENGKFAEVGN